MINSLCPDFRPWFYHSVFFRIYFHWYQSIVPSLIILDLIIQFVSMDCFRTWSIVCFIDSHRWSNLPFCLWDKHRSWSIVYFNDNQLGSYHSIVFMSRQQSWLIVCFTGNRPSSYPSLEFLKSIRHNWSFSAWIIKEGPIFHCVCLGEFPSWFVGCSIDNHPWKYLFCNYVYGSISINRLLHIK